MVRTEKHGKPGVDEAVEMCLYRWWKPILCLGKDQANSRVLIRIAEKEKGGKRQKKDSEEKEKSKGGKRAMQGRSSYRLKVYRGGCRMYRCCLRYKL
ncbi:MAG: hypothetical protein D3903_09965 [Candidatus Electrothrix sp. GM3_4]|nr:hypothetical protein [Candidatus Electrothrix sp. GM3_4]